jgi:hypothetical protein
MVIDTRNGDVVEWVRLDSERELFDVVALPMTRCPRALAPDNPDMQDAITFDDELPAAPAPAPMQASAVPARHAINGQTTFKAARSPPGTRMPWTA